MRKSVILSVVAAAALAVPAIAMAAPVTFQTAVTANNPYVYYRFNDAGGDETTAVATVGPNGFYNGDNTLTPPTPSGGVAGVGAATDNAVAFKLGSGATRNYMRSPISAFGSSVGASSYEFIYKVNEGFATNTIQSLFGVFSTTATDVDISLNSKANDNGGTLARSTRLYIKGSDGDANGAAFVSPDTGSSIYDGNYHHVVFTFDGSKSGVDAFAIYVDGTAQTLTDFSVVGTGATDADNDPDTFVNFNNASGSVDPIFAGRNIRVSGINGDLGSTPRLAAVTIDEAAIYGTVLTAEQVAAHATAAGFLVPEPASLAAVVGLGGLVLGRRRKA